MFEKEELQHARELIDSLVEISPDKPASWNKISFGQKLDRLSELIDALRFDNDEPEESDRRKTFRPTRIFADPSAGKIHFVGGGHTEALEDDAARKLMLPLLKYLHGHPGKGRAVLSIVRAFVRNYRPHCHMRDFQRTATGVLRIETNVRFAARELRKFGLLQYTQVEAFKTWRLSLMGILAAEHLPPILDLPDEKPLDWFWLATIADSLEPLQKMEQLISTLEAITKNSSAPWHGKEKFLELTMQTIRGYRAILSSSSIPNKTAREGAVEELLIKLNQSPEAEFVACAFDGVPASQLELTAKDARRTDRVWKD